jgi:hypothetical protein
MLFLSYELENVMKLLVPAAAALALSMASLTAAALTNADRYGEAANPAAAERTIVVGPNAGRVSVKRGEIVKFVANGREFAWNFDGLLNSFNLKQIAPQGAIDQDVSVTIEISNADAAG